MDGEALLERLHHYGFVSGRTPRPLRAVSKAAFLCWLVWANPFAHGHRGRALARWWAWQAWRRLVRRPVAVELPGGSWLQCPSESGIAGMLVATGAHEPAELAFLMGTVSAGDLVMDVGANIGVYTVALAGRGARVAAIEPSSNARAVLERSLAGNGLTQKARVFPVAVAEASGRRPFTAGLDVGNHLVDEPLGRGPGATEWVDVETLDGLVATHLDFFDRPVRILKVDAEGDDEHVLRGGGELLSRDQPVVVVETWEGGSSIRSLLGMLGYQPWRYSLESQRLEAVPPTWCGQANLIFIAPGRLEEVQEKLHRSSPMTATSLPRVRWWPR
jgi:FkbM family methyltransferase